MRKALIFDDDAQALNLLQTFLSVNDIDVSAHLNPTCLMYQTNSENCPLHEPTFHLIISDNNMPRMNGIDFYEDIHNKGCKISSECKALLSGEVTQEVARRANKIGIKVFEKPCSFEVLGRWLDGALKYSN